MSLEAALGRALVDRPIRRAALEVCRVAEVSLDDLRGAGRTRRLAHARQAAMWLARQTTDASLPEIGRFFHRDHTTVIHAIRAVEGRMNGGK